MKQYLILLFLFCLSRLYAQDTLVLNTPNTAGGAVNACAAIILKPGFSFKSEPGKSLTMKTGDAYCSPHVTQSLNLSDNQNYIITVTPLDATDKVDISPAALTLARGANALVTVQYFDGLGRPVETVQKGITPSKSDLVTYREYDAFGRESKSWLPVRAANNNGAFVGLSDFQSKASATYNNTAYNTSSDAAPYSFPVYEPSPLNRIERQYGPGANWHNNGKSIKTDYLTNSSNYPCAYYHISGDNLVRNGNYGNSQLYVTETTDEEGNTSYEFRDKLDRIVLQRQMDGSTKHDTYFVYDDIGLLRYTLSPLAADGTGNGSYNENSTVIKNYAYAYKYDTRRRCIWKQLPGCAPVYYVYDKADRLIFSQDGEQRENGEWSFSIPDVFGRVVLTGICKNTLSYSGNPLANTAVKGERTNTTNTYKGYTLSGITLTSYKVLSVNYYDDYEFMGNNGIPGKTDNDFKYEAVSGYGEQYAGTQGCEHKGLLTGSLVAYNRELYTAVNINSSAAIVEEAAIFSASSETQVAATWTNAKYYEEASPAQTAGIPSETAASTSAGIVNSGYQVFVVDPDWSWLASVMYYDHRGRLIQSKSKNHLGGVEKEYIALNFTGQPTQRKQVHSATGKTTQTEVYTCAYDHAGRLTQTKHRLNDGAETLLADNIYDELGRLKSTKSNNQSKLETVYGYNIRSRLTRIANYYFDENLNYTYNGNISAMSWLQDRYRQGYGFSYDSLSRIKSAYFSGFNGERYGTGYTYDKHGNITALYRYGGIYPALGAYGYIDRLTMNHNGNQLRNINDSGENVLTNPSDFKDYRKGGDVEYAYNANGAMTQDMNKGISEIQYNRLNLPKRIDIKSPVAEARNEYTYTVTGAKLRVVHRWNPAYSNSPVIGSAVNAGSLTEKVTIDYVGNKIYKNGVLEKILTENGYYENGKYYFYIRDHLGSNRVVADQAGNEEQSTQYYPFGMVMKETNREKQAFKFGGKELDMMNGLNLYDFVARPYDPNGWFLTPDPLAEKYYWISPYAYCLNNPILYIDPNGLAPIYAPDGTLIGTDDGGLQGKAIVMNKDNFVQGMTHDDAMKLNLGIKGFTNDETKATFFESYKGLKDRPDYDGKLTLSEANDWYRNGNGQPLYVDASKIDLSPVTTKDMKEGKGKVFNFASPSYANTETGLVYGNIKLTLLDASTGSVKLGGAKGLLDNYGFEMHEGGSKFRNFATKIGKAIAGNGTAYDIFNYNNGKVKVKK